MTRLAFVFSGMGSHRRGMGQALLGNTHFARSIEACDDVMKPMIGWSIKQVIESDEFPEDVHASVSTTLLLFAYQVSLANTWLSFGIRPHHIVGHSMGEVAAAHIAGGLSLEHAAQVMCRRTQLGQEMVGRGVMAFIKLPRQKVEQVLLDFSDQAFLAGENAPDACVISGETPAIDAVLRRLKESGVFCTKIKGALAPSHTPLLLPLRERLLELLSHIPAKKPLVPMTSTASGQLIDNATFDAQYWWQNASQTVEFSRAIQNIENAAPHVYLEISPHSIMATSIEECVVPMGRKPLVLGQDIEPALQQLRELFS